MQIALHRMRGGTHISVFTESQRGSLTPSLPVVSPAISCSLCHSVLSFPVLILFAGNIPAITVSHADWKEEMK